MTRAFPFAFFAALALMACSGSQETVDPTPPPPDDERGPPAYETFDPSSYDAEPPEPSAEVQHDVPEALMAGTISMPETTGPRVVQGYRIQVFSSAEKGAAEDIRDEATGWWRVVQNDLDAVEVMPLGLDADVDFNRPYYRVRLGAFEYRREAEAALPLVRRRFQQAFIVPDQVIIQE
ncbi:MAG: SPOR domain-containing protein [Bacteroidota bacterium]